MARGGLWHKGGMIAVVMVAGLADFVLGMVANSVTLSNMELTYTVLLLPLVLAWYIVTELGSILENEAYIRTCIRTSASSNSSVADKPSKTL